LQDNGSICARVVRRGSGGNKPCLRSLQGGEFATQSSFSPQAGCRHMCVRLRMPDLK
jgi:hypothetical protein